MSTFTYQYSRTIENIVIAVGILFKDLKVHIYNTSGADTGRTVDVSVVFGGVDRAYQSRSIDTSASQRYYTHNPKVGISLKSIDFDQSRMMGQNTFQYNYPTSAVFNDITSFIKYVNPTPRNFAFDIEIHTNTMSDMAQILENTLYKFNPDTNVPVREFSYIPTLERDLKITIDTAALEYNNEMDQMTRQEIVCTIPLTVYGFLYSPISTEKLIKTIYSNFFIDSQ